MRLASFVHHGKEQAGLIINSSLIPVKELNEVTGDIWPIEILEIIKSGYLDKIREWYNSNKEIIQKKFFNLLIPLSKITYAPLYRNPQKIWGIGLNYQAHAKDLSEQSPDEFPASFMKPTTAIIGFGDTIKLPLLSLKTTGEAELGIVIGKKTIDIEKNNWLNSIAGFTNIIDMTAEDILRKNPRYLTLCKSFDSFFSFGPQLITPDEINDIMNLTVSTVINKKVYRSNTVSNMTFPPDFLVSFHSKVMTLLPGDIISTGTPGAVELKHGDQIACKIDGFPLLTNKVSDLKEN